ncbi:protein kinase domain-containing protein [Chryseobacterium sp.]|uniref:protein kinase domain-containing protein n=1 Tax=Chryseobacterium sp. TaxID=1871047 RepID=UPI002FCB49E1
MSTKIDLRKLAIDFFKNETIIKTNIGDIPISPKLLGEGGTAIVYGSLDDKFAIKILIENIAEKESTVYKRFKQEFNNLTEISKKENCIVEFFDFSTLEIKNTTENHKFRLPFMVMRKYKYSLKNHLQNNPIKNITELDKLFENLKNIIQVLHNNKIIHRDLKPENIFIDDNENFILGDFGIAWFDKAIYRKEAKTKKSDRLANLNFSAPEQFLPNSAPSYSMDLFALGQILQWSITNRTIKGLGYKKISEILGFQAYYFDAIIEQLIHEDPQKRIQNIEELTQKLEIEKVNNYYNWLIKNNTDFNLASNIFKIWENNGKLPSAEQSEILLNSIDELIIPIHLKLFFFLAIILNMNESDYINYSINPIDFEEFTNYSGDNIFDTFEISLSRINEQGNWFDYNYFKSINFTAQTDSFELYHYSDDFKQRYICIYSEITINESSKSYSVLIWNNKNLEYRIMKNN